MAATKKELQKSANIFLAIGLVMSIGSRVAFVDPELSLGLTILFVIVALAGVVVWIIGCMRYVVSKGYSQWMGLIGLFSCIGLIILASLPDKWVDGPPPESPTNYPRYPQG